VAFQGLGSDGRAERPLDRCPSGLTIASTADSLSNLLAA